MSDLAVRRFREGDGDAVRRLHERSMADTPEYVPDAPDPDLADVPGHYFEDGEFLVGTLDDEIVAMGAYAPVSDWKHSFLDDLDESTRELTRMRIDPAHQRSGYGEAIYRELARRARAEGVSSLVLDTGAANERARAFYEFVGFDHRRTVAVEFDGHDLDLALYRTDL